MIKLSAFYDLFEAFNEGRIGDFFSKIDSHRGGNGSAAPRIKIDFVNVVRLKKEVVNNPRGGNS